MKSNDAIAGALCLVFGLVLIVISSGFPAIPGQPYGAATFPVLIGVGFVLVSLALIVKGVAGWRELPGIAAEGWGRSPGALLRMALTIALIILYILFSGTLGFVPTSFLVLITLFLVLKVRPLLAIVIAVLVTVAMQQAFGIGLRVPLPRNEFFLFLW
ncbi:MAG TPA: tripartite tricarboxylate transporter TctB family protein [Paracoccaceae bacterium]|nr:tripartite tricarboxylate transporter TctB family protein [Paracoccaceae bacterium]